MTTLPVIERELLVRARWRFTPWVRVMVVLLAGLVLIPLLNVHLVAPGRVLLGPVVLHRLGWLLFALCLLEGVRQTSDALSVEAREGTLGLLLLTDLSGWEVVLGKFAAASLNAFYSLLAAMPILGVSLALGGVTSGDFWRTWLALLNTLFLSLCCGLWMSSRGSEHYPNLFRAMGLILLLSLAPAVLRLSPVTASWPTLSPAVSLVFAQDPVYSSQPMSFWNSLAMIHALGWLMLADCVRRLGILWQTGAWEKEPEGTRAGGPFGPLINLWRSLRTREVELGELNPIVWLMSRERQQWAMIWIATVGPAVVGMGVQVVQAVLGPGAATAIWGLIPRLLACLLWAVVGSRTFAQAKRAGALELMLTTPLSAREMVHGHWIVLWSQMRLPVLAIAFLGTALQLMTQLMTIGNGMQGVSGFMLLYKLCQPGVQVLEALTICWVGTWFGVRARTPSLAVGLAVLIGLGVPWLMSAFLSASASLLANGGVVGSLQDWYWVPWLFHQVLQIACGGLLVWWSYRQLSTRFRAAAAGDLEGLRHSPR